MVTTRWRDDIATCCDIFEGCGTDITVEFMSEESIAGQSCSILAVRVHGVAQP